MNPEAWVAKLSAEMGSAIKECDARGANFTALWLRTEGPAILKALRAQIPAGQRQVDTTPLPFVVPPS